MSSGDADATQKLQRTVGDYVLGRKLGKGGFGSVYEARRRNSEIVCAVKLIQLSETDAERFRKEAIYPARIASQSMYVLAVQDFFDDSEQGWFGLVTELIPHGDLRDFLESQPRPLPLRQAIELALGIARGLKAIHDQKIVHQDLKPRNILMDRKDGQWVPKIADFGLARSSESVSLADFASPGYGAPEQLDLTSERAPGPESDLFSFGMILYELLTGEKPVDTQDLREYGRWLTRRRAPPALSTRRKEVGRELDALAAKLLEFDRDRRLVSADEAVRVLSQALARLDAPAEQKEDQKKKEKKQKEWRISRRAILAVAGMLLLGAFMLVLGAVAWWVWPRSGTDAALTADAPGVTRPALRTFSGHTDWVRSVAILPDSRSVLSGSDDSTLKLWDMASGDLLRTFSGHTDWVRAVAVSADGRSALSGSDDGTLKLWEISSGNLLRTFSGHNGLVYAAAISADGAVAVSGGSDNTVRSWDVASGNLLRTFFDHTSSVAAVAISPDGGSVLSGDNEGALKLWEVSSGLLLRRFGDNAAAIYAVAYSPDGRFALTGHGDYTVKLWELSSGELLRTFSGHDDWVRSVAYSRGGSYALSGSDDGTVKLWEVSSGDLLRTFTGNTEYVFSAMMSPDGRYVVSGGQDDTLRLWEVGN